MNIGVHASFQISVFIVFVYIPRSGIAGSHGSSIQILRWCTCCRNMPHASAVKMKFAGATSEPRGPGTATGMLQEATSFPAQLITSWGQARRKRKTLVLPPSLQPPSVTPIVRAWHKASWQSRHGVCRAQLQDYKVGENRMNLERRGNKLITGTVVCHFVLICRTSLYILATSCLLALCVANIFSHPVIYLLDSLWCLLKNKSF